MEIFRFFIRMSAFWGKEIFVVLRQPRLIFAMVLGPFLILFLFGLGLRIEPRALRTLFVAKENSAAADQIQKYATSLGPQLVFMGITTDLEGAKEKLRRGEVEVVAVAPDMPTENIGKSQQATFTLYHREIDPTQINYVQLFGQIYMTEVNRRILSAEIQQAQTQVDKYQEYIRLARAAATAMRDSMQRGDTTGTKQHRQELDQNIGALATQLTAGILIASIQQGNNSSSDNSIESVLNRIRQNESALGASDGAANNAADVEKVNQIDKDLGTMSAQLDEIKKVNPNVAVSPFRSEVKNVSDVQFKSVDYFAPSALALILQHLALTFAALSIVQEKRMGTMELFRVSPLSTAEMLFGKYLSFTIFAGAVGALLTALMVYILQVPMLGNWLSFAAVVFLLIFTSLGLGFVISLISQTDSQAIQYAMLALLASVFFSGAFLSLENLAPFARTVSWALPATYGIALFQDIMLRGYVPNLVILSGLAGIGLFLYVMSWVLLRRTLKIH